MSGEWRRSIARYVAEPVFHPFLWIERGPVRTRQEVVQTVARFGRTRVKDYREASMVWIFSKALVGMPGLVLFHDLDGDWFGWKATRGTAPALGRGQQPHVRRFDGWGRVVVLQGKRLRSPCDGVGGGDRRMVVGALRVELHQFHRKLKLQQLQGVNQNGHQPRQEECCNTCHSCSDPHPPSPPRLGGQQHPVPPGRRWLWSLSFSPSLPLSGGRLLGGGTAIQSIVAVVCFYKNSAYYASRSRFYDDDTAPRSCHGDEVPYLIIQCGIGK